MRSQQSSRVKKNKTQMRNIFFVLFFPHSGGTRIREYLQLVPESNNLGRKL